MKKQMKKNTLVWMLGLGALLAFTLAPASSSAQNVAGQARGDRIEGVWDSAITITDCSSGAVIASFRGLGLFIRGGANVQTNNQPPGSGSPAFGQWQNLGGGNYSATFRFFAFANGVFTGVQKVTRAIQLDRGGDTFSSVLSSEFFDPNGNLVATGCGTETATRVE